MRETGPTIGRSVVIRHLLIITLWTGFLGINFLGIGAPAVHAQSPAELRRENDQLRERIIELEAALAEAERKIEVLEQQTRNTRTVGQPAGATGNRTGPSDPVETALIDNVPDDPAACPDALYESLVDSYNATFPGIKRPKLTDVQHWVARVGTSRHKANWVIKPIGDVTIRGDTNSSIRIRIVQRRTGKAICSPVVLWITKAQAMRIRNATDVEHWEISGTFAANPRADRNRSEINDSIVSPKLIGPYAVFHWSFDVQQLRPIKMPNPKPQRR